MRRVEYSRSIVEDNRVEKSRGFENWGISYLTQKEFYST